MNEKTRAEDLISSGEILNDARATITLLARYAAQVLQMSAEDVVSYVSDYFKRNAPSINGWYVEKHLKYAAEHANDFPLKTLQPVRITAAELFAISKLSSIRDKSFVFAALAIAKFDVMVWPETDYWISGDRIGEIRRRANLSISYEDAAGILHRLYASGLINLSKKVNSCSFQISFAEAPGCGDEILLLTDSDYWDLGYCLRACYGQKYRRCEECGRWIKQAKNGRRRFCTNCAADNHRSIDATRKRRIRS